MNHYFALHCSVDRNHFDFGTFLRIIIIVANALYIFIDLYVNMSFDMIKGLLGGGLC